MIKRGLFFRGLLAVLFCQFLLQQSAIPKPPPVDAQPSIVPTVSDVVASYGPAIIEGARNVAPVVAVAAPEGALAVAAGVVVGTAAGKVLEMGIEKGTEIINDYLSSIHKTGTEFLAPNVGVIDGSYTTESPFIPANVGENTLVGDGVQVIKTGDVAKTTSISRPKISVTNNDTKIATISKEATFDFNQAPVISNQNTQTQVGKKNFKLCPDPSSLQTTSRVNPKILDSVPGVFDNAVFSVSEHTHHTGGLDRTHLRVSADGRPEDHNYIERNLYNTCLKFSIPRWHEKFKEWGFTSAVDAIDLRVFLVFGKYINAMQNYFKDYDQVMVNQNPNAHHYQRVRVENESRDGSVRLIGEEWMLRDRIKKLQEECREKIRQKIATQKATEEPAKNVSAPEPSFEPSEPEDPKNKKNTKRKKAKDRPKGDLVRLPDSELKRTIPGLIKQCAEHIFSPDHIGKNILRFGPFANIPANIDRNKEAICKYLEEFIENVNAQGVLRQGQNQFKVFINGFEAEIHCYIIDGVPKFIDLFPNHSNRIYKHCIEISREGVMTILSAAAGYFTASSNNEKQINQETSVHKSDPKFQQKAPQEESAECSIQNEPKVIQLAKPIEITQTFEQMPCVARNTAPEIFEEDLQLRFVNELPQPQIYQTVTDNDIYEAESFLLNMKKIRDVFPNNLWLDIQECFDFCQRVKNRPRYDFRGDQDRSDQWLEEQRQEFMQQFHNIKMRAKAERRSFSHQNPQQQFYQPQRFYVSEEEAERIEARRKEAEYQKDLAAQRERERVAEINSLKQKLVELKYNKECDLLGIQRKWDDKSKEIAPEADSQLSLAAKNKLIESGKIFEKEYIEACFGRDYLNTIDKIRVLNQCCAQHWNEIVTYVVTAVETKTSLDKVNETLRLAEIRGERKVAERQYKQDLANIENKWNAIGNQVAKEAEVQLTSKFKAQLIEAGKVLEKEYIEASHEYNSLSREKEENRLLGKKENLDLSASIFKYYNLTEEAKQHRAEITETLQNTNPIKKLECTVNAPAYWSDDQKKSFKEFSGSLTQCHIHERLVNHIGTTAKNYGTWYETWFDANKSYHIANLTQFVTHFAALARIYNNAGKIIPAYNLSAFCEALTNFEIILIDHIHGKDSSIKNVVVGVFRESAIDYFRKRLIHGIERNVSGSRYFLCGKITDASFYLKKALELAYINKFAFYEKIIKDAPTLIAAVEKNEEHAAEKLVAYVTEALYEGEVLGINTPDKIKQALQDAIHNEKLISQSPGSLCQEDQKLLAPITTIFTEALRALLEAAKANLLNGQIQEQNEVNEQDAVKQKAAQQAQEQEAKKTQTVQSLGRLDAANKAKAFDVVQSAHGQLNQLPGLLQSYGELLSLPERGYDANQCGYYAAHNAKLFAQNPGATREQLIEMLNDRNRFEAETLRPGVATIHASRELNRQPEIPARETLLSGVEILQLIPQNLRNQIIVIGAFSENQEENATNIAESEKNMAAFKGGQIEQLVFILPGDKNTHWLAARVTHGAQDALKMDIVDSLGHYRCGDPAFAEILQSLLAPEKEAQVAGGHEEPVVITGYAGTPGAGQAFLLKGVEQLKADFTKRVYATQDADMNMLLTARLEAIEKFEETAGKSLKEQLYQELNQSGVVLKQLEREYAHSEYLQVMAPGIISLMKQAFASNFPGKAFAIADLCREVIQTLQKGLGLLKNAQNNHVGAVAKAGFSQEQLQAMVMQPLEMTKSFFGAIGENEMYAYEDSLKMRSVQDRELIKLVEPYLEKMEEQKEALRLSSLNLGRGMQNLSWEELSEHGVEIGATLMLNTLALKFSDWFAWPFGHERIIQLTEVMQRGAVFTEQYAFEVAGFAKLNAQNGFEEVMQAVEIVKAHPELLKAGKPFFQVVQKVIKAGRM